MLNELAVADWIEETGRCLLGAEFEMRRKPRPIDRRICHVQQHRGGRSRRPRARRVTSRSAGGGSRGDPDGDGPGEPAPHNVEPARRLPPVGPHLGVRPFGALVACAALQREHTRVRARPRGFLGVVADPVHPRVGEPGRLADLAQGEDVLVLLRPRRAGTHERDVARTLRCDERLFGDDDGTRLGAHVGKQILRGNHRYHHR